MRRADLLAVTLVLVLMIISGLFTVARDLATIDLLRKDRAPDDPEFLREYVLENSPHIAGRAALGTGPISIIVQMDPETPAARTFLDEVLPRLQEEYIDTGWVSLYQTSAIGLEDIRAGSRAYLAAAAIECGDPVERFTRLFDPPAEPVIDRECRYRLATDAFDVERSRRKGMNPIIYIGIGDSRSVTYGVPDWERLQHRIRDYQVALGG